MLRSQLQDSLASIQSRRLQPIAAGDRTTTTGDRHASSSARPPQPPRAIARGFSIASDADSNLGPSASQAGNHAGTPEQRQQNANLRQVVEMAVQQMATHFLSAPPSLATESVPEVPKTALTRTTTRPPQVALRSAGNAGAGSGDGGRDGPDRRDGGASGSRKDEAKSPKGDPNGGGDDDDPDDHHDRDADDERPKSAKTVPKKGRRPGGGGGDDGDDECSLRQLITIRPSMRKETCTAN